MSASSAAKLSGSSATYSFDVTLNGAISTEGGAVLLEKSQLVGVVYPLRNNQKDASLLPYTGRCWPWTRSTRSAPWSSAATARAGQPAGPGARAGAGLLLERLHRPALRVHDGRPDAASVAAHRPGGRRRRQAHVAPGELAPHLVLTPPGGRATGARAPIEGRVGRAPAGSERYQLRKVMVMLYSPSSPLCAFTLLTIIITTA